MRKGHRHLLIGKRTARLVSVMIHYRTRVCHWVSEWVTLMNWKKHQKTSEGEEQAYFCWCLNKDILLYLVEATGKGNQEQDFCLQSSRLSIYGICCEGRKNLNIRSRRKLFWVNSGPESQDRRKSAKLCYPLRRIISQWPHKESAMAFPFANGTPSRTQPCVLFERVQCDDVKRVLVGFCAQEFVKHDLCFQKINCERCMFLL